VSGSLNVVINLRVPKNAKNFLTRRLFFCIDLGRGSWLVLFVFGFQLKEAIFMIN
jgi:hypothetical protein